MNAGCFLWFLCTHCNCWEYKSTLNVWVQFKNSKWIIPWGSHYTNSIIFLSWSSALWGRLWRFILVNPLAFALNFVKKALFFFITCNDVLEKEILSLPWKKTCCYGYMIIFILFTKSMRNQNALFTQFSYLFQMVADSG